MREALAFTIKPGILGLGAFDDLGGLISAILPTAVSLAGLALFAFLLLGGIKYLTSGGDEKSIDSAKKTITNAVLGMGIVFVSFWIIRIIETVFGLDVTGFNP